MILVEEHAILVEHRRSGAAVIVAQIAELRVPEDLPVEVERGQPVSAE
jgi:hypothetical protein